jgi:hypothetical protein
MRSLRLASLGLVACNAIFGIEEGLPLEGGTGGVGAGPVGGAGGDGGAAGAGAQGGDGGGPGGAGGEGGGPPTPICDPLDGPIDPTCGLFVDPNAAPGGDGSMGAPLQTFSAAWSLVQAQGVENIYICGDAVETLTNQYDLFGSKMSIFGQLACEGFVSDSSLRPTLAGTSPDRHQFRFNDAEVLLHGLILTAPPGPQDIGASLGATSYVIRSEATSLVIRSSRLESGSGGDGRAGSAALVAGGPTAGSAGNCPGGPGMGGVAGSCGAPSGGLGGGALACAASGDGLPGDGPGGGAGGLTATCSPGQPGVDGAHGASAVGASPLAPLGPGGILDPVRPSAEVGQPGGGGGGGAACGVGGAGGGGGSGGCPGLPGSTGTNGGSSFLLVAFGGSLTLVDTGLYSGRGGDGGDGSPGTPGSLGGLSGAAFGNAAQGGSGGRGGHGGSGGGGAGGTSALLVLSGVRLTFDPATVASSFLNSAGRGGDGGLADFEGTPIQGGAGGDGLSCVIVEGSGESQVCITSWPLP